MGIFCSSAAHAGPGTALPGTGCSSLHRCERIVLARTVLHNQGMPILPTRIGQQGRVRCTGRFPDQEAQSAQLDKGLSKSPSLSRQVRIVRLDILQCTAHSSSHQAHIALHGTPGICPSHTWRSVQADKPHK